MSNRDIERVLDLLEKECERRRKHDLYTRCLLNGDENEEEEEDDQ